MSLINKMLQDLDARGSQGAGFAAADIKSVVRPEPRVKTPLVAAGLALAIVLAAGAVFGWRYLTRPAPAPVLPPPVAIVPKVVQPVAVPEPAKAAVPRKLVKPKAVAVIVAPVPAGRQASTPQTAESQYRAAIAQLQGGRVNDAIGTLERTLKTDARHEPASLALFGLGIAALLASRRRKRL